MMTNVIKKFETESSSIDYLCRWLEKKGFTDINPTQYYNKYCWYDISAKFNDELYLFEVKRRYFNSDKYGDAVYEYYKHIKFIEALNTNQIQRGYLVCLFNDIMTLSDVKFPYLFDTKEANKTTEFEDKTIIEKQFVHFKQHFKRDYDEELFK